MWNDSLGQYLVGGSPQALVDLAPQLFLACQSHSDVLEHVLHQKVDGGQGVISDQFEHKKMFSFGEK